MDDPSDEMAESERARDLLLEEIRRRLPELRELRSELDRNRAYEDGIYRFWHHSFKVFGLQKWTKKIVGILQSLAPEMDLDPWRYYEMFRRFSKRSSRPPVDGPLHPWFMKIVRDGTSHDFDMERDNHAWMERPRKIVEAFFHAKYMLEMVVQWGEEVDEDGDFISSGSAAVQQLYGIR